MSMISIGILAKKLGMRPSTLRYYEAYGLIRSIGRGSRGRLFDELGLRSVAAVKWLQDLGFTLKEIKEIFLLRGSPASLRRQLDRRFNLKRKQLRDELRLAQARKAKLNAAMKRIAAGRMRAYQDLLALIKERAKQH